MIRLFQSAINYNLGSKDNYLLQNQRGIPQIELFSTRIASTACLQLVAIRLSRQCDVKYQAFPL